MADDQVPPPAPPPPESDRDVRVPEPRMRRRTPGRSIVLSLLATLFTLVLIAVWLGIWAYTQSIAPGPLKEARNVIIERGTDNEGVARLLEQRGIVDNAHAFLALIWLTRPHAPIIKAGEYAFAPHVSMRDALALIRSGHTVTYKLTLPEGWTSARILERIRKAPAFTGEITRPAPEGSLLPDTYLYQRGTTRNEMIARIQAARDRLLKELWAKRARNLPFTTPEQAVILASIVEKETGLAEERPRVAAVFVNRLRRHMRLQSDPTIIYGITMGKARLGRPLTHADIAEKTPYNTYQIDGLPPTPIANPGRDALAAVLDPMTSDELYFVADGTGGHVFASSLKQHRANVKRWRQIERDQRQAEATRPETTDTAKPDVAATRLEAADAATPPVAEAQPAKPAEEAAKPSVEPSAQAPESPPEQAGQSAQPSEKPSVPAKQIAASAEAPKPGTMPSDLRIPPSEPSPQPAAHQDAATEPTGDQPALAEITNDKPGTFVRIAGHLVPFPRPRPPR